VDRPCPEHFSTGAIISHPREPTITAADLWGKVGVVR
jgi:hypothetical protein